jgi:hypothetical protein
MNKKRRGYHTFDPIVVCDLSNNLHKSMQFQLPTYQHEVDILSVCFKKCHSAIHSNISMIVSIIFYNLNKMWNSHKTHKQTKRHFQTQIQKLKTNLKDVQHFSQCQITSFDVDSIPQGEFLIEIFLFGWGQRFRLLEER